MIMIVRIIIIITMHIDSMMFVTVLQTSSKCRKALNFVAKEDSLTNNLPTITSEMA